LLARNLIIFYVFIFCQWSQAAPSRCVDSNQLRTQRGLPQLAIDVASKYWVTVDPLKVGQGQSWFDGFEFNLPQSLFTNYYIKRTAITSVQKSIRQLCWRGESPTKLEVYIGGQKLSLKKIKDRLHIDAGLFGRYELRPGDKQTHLEQMDAALLNPPPQL
jgi:hypothetical protein